MLRVTLCADDFRALFLFFRRICAGFDATVLFEFNLGMNHLRPAWNSEEGRASSLLRAALR